MEAEEDQDRDLEVNVLDDSASDPDTGGVPLYTALKPSAAGLSFAVKANDSNSHPEVEFRVQCATYKCFAVDDEGQEVEGSPVDRNHERWRRVPHFASVLTDLAPGERRIDLGPEGIEQLELYVLVAPHADLLTVTTALANKRDRGQTRTYDEEQHFFQVGLEVGSVRNGEFAPRPSRRAETDEDSRSAALIYRDVTEFVVGHTCSAQAVFSRDDDGGLDFLKTEWVPTIAVPSISTTTTSCLVG